MIRMEYKMNETYHTKTKTKEENELIGGRKTQQKQ